MLHFVSARVAILLTSIFCSASAFAQANALSFTNLGTLSGDTGSSASAVSASGAVVVGQSSGENGTTRAFRWTQAGGMQEIGSNSIQARGVSADGSVVVGTTFSNNMIRAFRWTQVEGLQSLGTLYGGSSYGHALSADGSAAFGTAGIINSNRAFRWTQAEGLQSLGAPQGFETSALDVNADASVVVGSASYAGIPTAFRWTQSGGFQLLGTLPAHSNSVGYGVNDDGSVVVGLSRGDGTSINRAFRWTQAGGMQDLGTLDGWQYSSAYAVSANGSIVVGASSAGAFLWTPSTGIILLKSYLESNSVNVSGWALDALNDISADGKTVVGTGTYNGQTRGFVVSGLSFQGTNVLLTLESANSLTNSWQPISITAGMITPDGKLNPGALTNRSGFYRLKIEPTAR